jgi:PDZ domain-containing protein
MQQEPLNSAEQVAAPPPRKRRRWRSLLAIVVVAALLAVAFLVPIPVFFAYLPGPVQDIEGLVTVTGASTYSSEGSLYLTTVSVDTEVTFAEWVVALIDSTEQIVSRESVTGGESLDELRRQQREEMADSKESAEIVALGALGIATPEGKGARIDGLVPDTPAARRLREGDVITGIDGEEISTLCDVGRAVGAHEPGETVRVTVLRDGDTQTLTIDAAENPNSPGRAFLGIAMTPDFTFDSGLKVDFKTGRIAGPSAGLMFSLALYDHLTPDDLTGGRKVAGTGTINCDGSVGPIGGIRQKVAGAEEQGAEVFISPLANADDARAVADDIEIVAVDSFYDALDYLSALE